MTLGLFDIVGPVMHGPSSNHTGGANRIGYLAKEIMGGTPDKIQLGFHRVYMGSYAGQHTHSAMIAGLLGHREYDDASVDAMKELAAKKIPWEAYAIAEEDVSRNTFRTRAEINGDTWEINGDSIGGGNIIIDRINGLKIELNGNQHLIIVSTKDKGLFAEAISAVSSLAGKNLKQEAAGQNLGDKWLYIGAFAEVPPALADLPEAIQKAAAAGRLSFRKVKPLFTFASANDSPLFTTFAEMLELCQKQPILDVVLDYESRRSQVSHQAVLDEALFMVQEWEKALDRGENQPINLIGGLTDADDGKRMAAYAKSGNVVVNEMFATALARAVILAQLNAAGSKIVAAPTGGSAGTLPGALFSAAERYGKSRTELAQAFLIAASIGLIIGNKASFSGTIGGCQSEVGIGAAMGAGAIIWMAGGSSQQIIQGATIALKNVLGLTCDPPAGCTEVPCIKRNAMGVAVAFMGADMGLAGIVSAITPDDVVDALAETQKLIPNELKFSHCGGLATTKSGLALNEHWQQRLKTLE